MKVVQWKHVCGGNVTRVVAQYRRPLVALSCSPKSWNAGHQLRRLPPVCRFAEISLFGKRSKPCNEIPNHVLCKPTLVAGLLGANVNFRRSP